jgi:hypothetical protein
LEYIRRQEPGFHGGDDALLTFALNHAVTGSHLDVARHLLEQGAKWDCNTIERANIGVIELLMEFGFDVNDSLVGGSVLLLQAVVKKDEEMITFLLSHGANPNLGPPKNPQATRVIDITPVDNCGAVLNACAAYSTPDVFRQLLAHGATLSNAIPLHIAASSTQSPPEARLRMMEFLVEEIGIDVNANDDVVSLGTLPDGTKHGCLGTPLMYARRWGRTEEADWLIAHGADPNVNPTRAG